MLKDAKSKLQKLEKIIKDSSNNLKKFKKDAKTLKDNTSQKNYAKCSDNFCKSFAMGARALELVCTFFTEYCYSVNHGTHPQEALEASIKWLDDPYMEKKASNTWTTMVEGIKFGKFETLMAEAFMNEKDFSSGIDAVRNKFDAIYDKICKEVDAVTDLLDKAEKLDTLLEKDTSAIMAFCKQFLHSKKFNTYPNATVRLSGAFDSAVKRDIALVIKNYCYTINVFKKTEYKDVDKRKWFREQQLMFKLLDGYLKNKVVY